MRHFNAFSTQVTAKRYEKEFLNFDLKTLWNIFLFYRWLGTGDRTVSLAKELSFCHKLWFYNRHTFSTWWCKPLIFQTIIIWSKMIHSLKYLRSPTIKCKDIGIRKSELVTKTKFLWEKYDFNQLSNIAWEDNFRLWWDIWGVTWDH